MDDILTLDDLVQFCESNHLIHFSSEETGKSIHVSVPVEFEELETSDPYTLYGTAKIFHTGINVNGSNVTDDAALKILPTIKYKPLLANFTTDKEGNPDFTSHDKKTVVGKDGKKKTVYIEHQIGCFTAKDPYIQYDKELERNFIYAEFAIPRTYTPAASIIERKQGTKVSAELEINEMSFDKENEVLVFSDIDFVGCTCLGVDPLSKKPIGEGMKGSNLTLESFGEKEKVFESDEKLIKTLEELNKTLSRFNKDSEKGGSKNLDKFNELLAKYNKKATDVTFSIDGMDDETLEKAFYEAFSEKTPKDPEPAPAGNKENGDLSKGTRVTIKEGDTVVKEFSLSLSDMDYALRNLVNKAYASKDGWYSTSIYPDDSNVVFYDVDSDTRKYYRQSYEKDGEEFKLVGERVEVKPAWLSADEQAAVDAMKANYSALETEVKTYRKKEALEINKSVVTDKKFASIANTKEVSELMNSEEFASMSKDEVTAKLNAIVVDYVASGKIADFSARKSSMVGLPIKTSQKNSRYGGIFRNHNN